MSLRDVERLAKAAGEPVSYGSVSQIERAERQRPDPAMLEALAHIYGWESFQALIASDALLPASPGGGTDGVSEERLRQIAREEAERVAAERLPSNVTPTSNTVIIDVRAEASAGGGQSAKLVDKLELPASWTRGRGPLVAVRIVGTCMHPYLLPGDTAIFERVPDDQISDGTRVLITLLDHEEDGTYQVKYLTWAKNGEHKVILTAEDHTHLEEDYDRVRIEGRYWKRMD